MVHNGPRRVLWSAALVGALAALLAAACGGGGDGAMTTTPVPNLGQDVPTLDASIDIRPLMESYGANVAEVESYRIVFSVGQYIHGLSPTDLMAALQTMVPAHDQKGLTFDGAIGLLFLGAVSGADAQGIADQVVSCLPKLPELNQRVSIRGFARDPTFDSDLGQLQDLIAGTCTG